MQTTLWRIVEEGEEGERSAEVEFMPEEPGWQEEEGEQGAFDEGYYDEEWSEDGTMGEGGIRLVGGSAEGEEGEEQGLSEENTVHEYDEGEMEMGGGSWQSLTVAATQLLNALPVVPTYSTPIPAPATSSSTFQHELTSALLSAPPPPAPSSNKRAHTTILSDSSCYNASQSLPSKRRRLDSSSTSGTDNVVDIEVDDEWVIPAPWGNPKRELEKAKALRKSSAGEVRSSRKGSSITGLGVAKYFLKSTLTALSSSPPKDDPIPPFEKPLPPTPKLPTSRAMMNLSSLLPPSPPTSERERETSSSPSISEPYVHIAITAPSPSPTFNHSSIPSHTNFSPSHERSGNSVKKTVSTTTRSSRRPSIKTDSVVTDRKGRSWSLRKRDTGR